MQPFILLAGRRSGTTLLVKLLDSHPQVKCIKEIFGTRRRLRYFRVDKRGSLFYKFRSASAKRQLDYIFRRRQLIDAFLAELYTPDDDVKALGGRMSYGQAEKYHDVIEWAAENNVKVIHLVRENALKAIVSHFTAKKMQVYHTTVQVEAVTIQMPPDKLKNLLTARLNRTARYHNLFKDKQYCQVTYESLVANRDAELGRILDFLNVDTVAPLTADLVKQNPDSLEDILENYAEIYQAFKGTAFEKYLVM